jgi:aryl-alcohol dehydrogenase
MDILGAVARAADQPFSVEPLRLQAPRDNEVLVRIVGAGICHTDLITKAGEFPVPPKPVVLGHEGSGIVESVGQSVTKVKPGDSVVLTFLSCGVCPSCLDDKPYLCVNIFPLNFFGCRADGSHTHESHAGEVVYGAFFGQSSFATYALAQERNVVKAPTDVPLELLGPLGCGVQTGAGAVLNALQPKAGSSLAVFGCGAVGLSAVMAAKIAGCAMIVAVDIHNNRLDLARQLGATHAINAKTTDPVKQLQEWTGGRGLDHTIEASGLPGVFRQAVDALAGPGSCALVGAAAPGTPVTLDMGSLLLGRTIIGVLEGNSVPDRFIPHLIDLYKAGQFPFDKLVSYFPFDQINEAVEAAESGAVIKPILCMPVH